MKDLLPLLEKIPIWRRIAELPRRVDELERRLAALEQRPALPICAKCGIGHRRLDREEKMTGAFAVFNDSGTRIRVFKCDQCGFEDRES